MPTTHGGHHLLADNPAAVELQELEAPAPAGSRGHGGALRGRLRQFAVVAVGSAGAAALVAASCSSHSVGSQLSHGPQGHGHRAIGVEAVPVTDFLGLASDEGGEPAKEPAGKQAEAGEKPAAKDGHLEKKAAEKCGMATADSKCYKNVVWAMTDGIKTHAEWYPGLTKKSPFEDFQRHLSLDDQNECPAPCKKPGCETAKPGSPCFENAQWSMTTGIAQHPEWYQGLTEQSRMEDFQDHIHKSNATICPKAACNPQPFKPVTLFCWMVVRPDGYELPLVQAQSKAKAGVFACDDYLLISNKELNIEGVKTLIIGSTSVSGYTGDGTSPNAPIFVDAWDKVKQDGRYLEHDWVVKCDPDTVLLPFRLKDKLMPDHQPSNPYPTPYTPAPGSGQWVTNCDKMASWGKGWGDGWPMMYGSIEIISLQAINKYFAHVDDCKMSFPWQSQGEDAFMGLCLRKLQVGELFMKQGDGACAGGACTDPNYQAFHPRKDITSWMQCWGDATR